MLEVELTTMNGDHVATVKVACEEPPDIVIWGGRAFTLDEEAFVNNEGYGAVSYFEGTLAFAIPERF